ncbi:short chain oxidoreductase [Colletotrichum truncatum]|uniref:Short chain oxidoreductase n=1 Tax=Colletotrichum truncatum TaxID=5467 RepID=A0ACC3YW32_COLTU|nr:short chain oxidoreductase [Colletotrichum truncatum]KAF6791126.1 short chain oxidoreductase [Colletotrichum truncatum]
MSKPLSSPEPWSLAGKTAIVTGASRGIGRAIALHFARKGLSKIAITYMANRDAAQATLDECRKLGIKHSIAIQADALDPDFGTKIIRQVLQGLETTTIDILINNAVLADPSAAKPISETSLKNFSEIMQANVYAPVSLTMELMPYLPTYGGRVVFISSCASKQANSDPTITYGASKATLDSFMRSFAENFAQEKRATFNSVIVGLTATDAWNQNKDLLGPDFLKQQLLDTSAADRIGVPEDIAYIVGFLASEEGRWVSGAAVSANGGNRKVLAALG